jgi:hypothetical protein
VGQKQNKKTRGTQLAIVDAAPVKLSSIFKPVSHTGPVQIAKHKESRTQVVDAAPVELHTASA